MFHSEKNTKKEGRMPKTAFLAVTLLCNSRCIMCDIWKNKGEDFLPLEVYRKLPASLEDIAITGGEPFLRPDIPELVSVLKATCPRARILITTHGFMTGKIEKQIDSILTADPRIAFRISMDGIGKTHDEIRGIPQAFEKARATLKLLKRKKIKDLGVAFTLMHQNAAELREVYLYTKKHQLHFSLNLTHDSPVYFGMGKTNLNVEPSSVRKQFDFIFWNQLSSLNPKNWAKAWFNRSSFHYLMTHKRPLVCGAGENFFYMDSHANIYSCQFKDWLIGNLSKTTFDELWTSAMKKPFLQKAHQCHDCWMVCTARDTLKEKRWAVLGDLPRLMKDVFFN